MHELRDLHRRALEQQAARKIHGYGKELDSTTSSAQSERARTVSPLLDQPQAVSSPLLQHESVHEFPSAVDDNAARRAPPSALRDRHADNLPAPAGQRTECGTTADQPGGEAAPPPTSTMPSPTSVIASHTELPAAPSSAAPAAAAAKKRSASVVPAITSAKKRSASASEAATQAEVRRRRVQERGAAGVSAPSPVRTTCAACSRAITTCAADRGGGGRSSASAGSALTSELSRHCTPWS